MTRWSGPLLILAGLLLALWAFTGCATTEDPALVAYDRAARMSLVESRYQRSGVERFQDAPIRIR